MADIFVSYAAEDRERARNLADALEERGWTVWWDREIPLGRVYDDVIEQALASARCVVVLWSQTSVASEWVRSEAAEARRRGILVPAFLESVEPPLAFRLLHGADLTTWKSGTFHDEFEQLATRVGELLAHTTDPAVPLEGPISRHAGSRGRWGLGPRGRIVALATALAAGTAGIIGMRALRSEPPAVEVDSRSTATADRDEATPAERPPATPPGETPVGRGDLDSLALALENVLGTGGAQQTLGTTTAFELKEIAVHLAFVSKEQASAFQAFGLSEGAVVMMVGPGPAQEAGLRAGDVITAIDRAPIHSDHDLRQALRRVGPGKTRYEVRRASETLTLEIECPGCTP